MQPSVHPSVNRYSLTACRDADTHAIHTNHQLQVCEGKMEEMALVASFSMFLLGLSAVALPDANSKPQLLAGRHSGDLEIQYEQGDLVYASLTGQCAEVDVQLSQEVVSLQPTYVNTTSQRCFRSGFCCSAAHAATS